MDRLSALLDRFRVTTKMFHTGPLCGVTTFAAVPGRGFIHVLRAGEVEVVSGTERLAVDRPSLLFYPRPVEHSFRIASASESDFACATFDFVGGTVNPLVRTLPAVLIVPLDELPSLAPTLELLFAEVDEVRCGRPIVADRLFEVVLIQLLRWLLDGASTHVVSPGLLSGLADERLAGVLVAIHDDPGGDWTLSTMARAAAMSRSAFAARFRDRVGQPPADYVIDWRLTVAQDRLRAGAPATVVAAEVGYASTSAFTRVFTQRLGASPRAWLAQVGGGSVD